MRQKKRLKELTIKDNFLFAAVMMEEENCRKFLEISLGIPIERVEVSREKSIVYHPEYKGVRLDVFAKDENNTHFNVEMQVMKKVALEKRSRYYHSQIDMELLVSGCEYSELPDTYVIFVCDFDPFGQKKYCYTFENHCLEVPDLQVEDGSKTIFLSTCGENESEVSQELVKFLGFVKADLARSEEDFEDDYVKDLQATIRKIKGSREMEERFMILEEMLKDEYATGKAEGRAEGIAEGRAEGIAEGRAEGIAELREETIRKMLSKKKFSYEEIAELNATSVEQVKEIEKSIL